MNQASNVRQTRFKQRSLIPLQHQYIYYDILIKQSQSYNYAIIIPLYNNSSRASHF